MYKILLLNFLLVTQVRHWKKGLRRMEMVVIDLNKTTKIHLWRMLTLNRRQENKMAKLHGVLRMTKINSFGQTTNWKETCALSAKASPSAQFTSARLKNAISWFARSVNPNSQTHYSNLRSLQRASNKNGALIFSMDAQVWSPLTEI